MPKPPQTCDQVQLHALPSNRALARLRRIILPIGSRRERAYVALVRPLFVDMAVHLPAGTMVQAPTLADAPTLVEPTKLNKASRSAEAAPTWVEAPPSIEPATSVEAPPSAETAPTSFEAAPSVEPATSVEAPPSAEAPPTSVETPASVEAPTLVQVPPLLTPGLHMRFTDSLVAISRSTKHQVEAFFDSESSTNGERVGIPISSFHLGCELDLVDRTRKPRKGIRALFTDHMCTLLVVGSIEPRKKHEYILDAFDEVWRRVAAASLAIIGKHGWKSEEFLARLEAHPLRGKQLFLLRDCFGSRAGLRLSSRIGARHRVGD
jgi:hypothetical protein